MGRLNGAPVWCVQLLHLFKPTPGLPAQASVGRLKDQYICNLNVCFGWLVRSAKGHHCRLEEPNHILAQTPSTDACAVIAAAAFVFALGVFREAVELARRERADLVLEGGHARGVPVADQRDVARYVSS